MSWEWQIRIFVDEIKNKYDKCWNFRQAQVGWNKPVVIRNWQYKTRYFYKTDEVYKKLFSNM